jgi:hypothetical protein
MQEKINQIIDEINSFKANDFKDAEEFRLKFLSKNGKVSILFDEFKEVSPEDKRALGKPINELKNIAQNKFIWISHHEEISLIWIWGYISKDFSLSVFKLSVSSKLFPFLLVLVNVCHSSSVSKLV